MNNPQLYIQAHSKICWIIAGLDDISQCGVASKVIDVFEERFGREENKEDIHKLRDALCDTTFELYFKKYGRK